MECAPEKEISQTLFFDRARPRTGNATLHGFWPKKLNGAVARQREHERWWEKPLDLDAGYDDDFFAVFGDGM